jgi:hypothetical protein
LFYINLASSNRTPVSLGSNFAAAKYTPLSALGEVKSTSGDVLEEMRLYYLNNERKLAEAIYHSSNKSWTAGTLIDANVGISNGAKFVSSDWAVLYQNGTAKDMLHHIFYQNGPESSQTISMLTTTSGSPFYGSYSGPAEQTFDSIQESALAIFEEMIDNSPGFPPYLQRLRIYMQEPSTGDLVEYSSVSNTVDTNVTSHRSEWLKTASIERIGKVGGLTVVPRYARVYDRLTILSEISIFFAQNGVVKELLWTHASYAWKQPARGNVVDQDAWNAVAAGEDSVYWQHRETGDIRETKFNTDPGILKWQMMEEKIA